MKRMLSYGAVAFACCLLLAQPARAAFDTTANIAVGNNLVFTDAFNAVRTNPGGPFLGTITNNGSSWVAYCVESGPSTTTENISFNTTYKVQSISANIASATGNIVTEAAKYLYYAAGHGLLSNYNPTVKADNTALQNAIWSLVIRGDIGYAGPVNVDPTNNNSTVLRATTGNVNTAGTDAYYRKWALDNLDLALANRIAIVNPVTNNAAAASVQSMLFEVPEPASLVVWSVLAGSAAGLTMARRRRQASSNGRWSEENRSAIFAVVDKCDQH